jgi:hypothetical protein
MYPVVVNGRRLRVGDSYPNKFGRLSDYIVVWIKGDECMLAHRSQVHA